MGQLTSKLPKMLDEFNTTHSGIVMLGLDASGKTTALCKLKDIQTYTVIPTVGFNVEKVKVKDLTFTMWDVGGQDKLRPLWRQYYANSDALIFFVDSSDQERLKEAAYELHNILSDPEMHGVPVLVFANKQDLPGAASTSELTDKLRLREMKHRNKWHVQASNAKTGDGLYEGLEIVARMTREHKKDTGR